MVADNLKRGGLRGSAFSLILVMLVFFSFSETVLAKNQPLDCISTMELSQLNPETFKIPLLFWKAKVHQSLATVYVTLPSGEQYFMIAECSMAEIRNEKPSPTEEITRGSGEKCKPMSPNWLRVTENSEVLWIDSEPQWDLSHPNHAVAFYTTEALKANVGSRWIDPYMTGLVNTLSNSLTLGLSISTLVASYAVQPKTFLGRRGKGLGKGLGWTGVIVSVLLQSRNHSEASKLLEENTTQAENLAKLIDKIDEQTYLRLDGTDEARNLEDVDGYSVLYNALEDAINQSTQIFCKE